MTEKKFCILREWREEAPTLSEESAGPPKHDAQVLRTEQLRLLLKQNSSFQRLGYHEFQLQHLLPRQLQWTRK